MITQRICIGVVENEQQQILVGKRKPGTHLEGCWEFPGGKVSRCESFKLALRRELYEEIGIRAHAMSRIFEFQHQYEDRCLHFQVFKVTGFSGQVRPVEKQQLQWVSKAQLPLLNFPAANSSMLDALSMPAKYMIADQDVLRDQLFSVARKQLEKGISQIQYRACKENKETYISHAKQLKKLCVEYDAKLICNCDPVWALEVEAHGIHLNSRRLSDIYHHPLEYKSIECFSASCHNEKEVAMANKVGVRCILIGPVNPTQSHVDVQAIGWSRFSQLCFIARVPVYALGGLSLDDCKNANVHGAQGIAAIRAFIN
tara:strand:+ start:1504 stop:2445 length:942 start_codon:yes stop_codon:yes gene_type:complete